MTSASTKIFFHGPYALIGDSCVPVRSLPYELPSVAESTVPLLPPRFSRIFSFAGMRLLKPHR